MMLSAIDLERDLPSIEREIAFHEANGSLEAAERARGRLLRVRRLAAAAAFAETLPEVRRPPKRKTPRPSPTRPRASARARRSPRTARPQSGDEGGGDDGSGPSPDDADPPDLLTVAEIAARLGLAGKTIYNLRCEGRLPFAIVEDLASRRWYARRDDVEAYARSRFRKVEPRPTVSPVDDATLERDRADRERRLSRLLDGVPEGGVQ
jgi:hypothetical protein